MKNKIISMVLTAAISSSVSVLAVNNSNDKIDSAADLTARTDLLEQQVKLLKNRIADMQSSKGKKIDSGLTGQVGDNSKYQLNSLFELYAHGPVVVTSPYFGMRRPDDNHSNLLVKLPSMNEDLVLLKTRQKMDAYAKEFGIPIPSRPIISISGGVEGQFSYESNRNFIPNSSAFDVNFTRAELDIVAEAGPWATAAMIFDYDDSYGTGYGSKYTTTQVNNSRIRLSRGWMTFGHLETCPVYLTLGQIYAPFGSYGSNMVTKASTSAIGKTKDRMLVLGYSHQLGIFAQIYALSGETKPSASQFTNHTGFNLGYRLDGDVFALNAGIGAIGNLAESDGMQKSVFNIYKGTEYLTSRVPGLNAYAKTTFFGTYDLLAEYIGAAKHYNASDFTFNGRGARPQAMNIEGDINFKVLTKDSRVFAGYGFTSDALLLNVPKQSYFVGCSMNPIKYTLVSLEYRHDVGYNYGDTSSNGSGSITSTVSNGRHNNRVTAEVGVYF